MTCKNCNDTLRLNFEVPLVDGQCDACRFEAQTQKENAEAQAELNVYNQMHGTHYHYPEEATAFFYECEGGGIRRDDLLKFPKLLAF